MPFSLPDLEKLNKIALENPEFEKLLKQIIDYKDTDPNAALTKLRTYLEKFLAIIYLKEFNERPNKPMLEDMLNKLRAKEGFKERFPRRVENRFKTIQDITNAAVHGEQVESDDVLLSLNCLLDIGKWYFENYEISLDKISALNSFQNKHSDKNIIFNKANNYFVKLMYKESLPLLEESLELGHIDAPFYLGYLFSEGIYVDNDDNVAKNYYTIAIERGNLLGYYGLKPIVINNLNVDQVNKYDSIALDYLEKQNILLDTQKNTFYCFILSKLYAKIALSKLNINSDFMSIYYLLPLVSVFSFFKFNSIKKSLDKSKEILELISKDFIPAGNLRMYSIIIDDLGRKALSTYERDIRKHKNRIKIIPDINKLLPAWVRLGELASQNKDFAQSAAFYRRAAEAGDRNAQLHLSRLYLEGIGVMKNVERANYWQDMYNEL